MVRTDLEDLQYVGELVGVLGELLERAGDDIPLLEVEEVERRVHRGHVRHGLQQRRALQPRLRQRLAHGAAEALVLHVAPPPGRAEHLHQRVHLDGRQGQPRRRQAAVEVRARDHQLVARVELLQELARPHPLAHHLKHNITQ